MPIKGEIFSFDSALKLLCVEQNMVCHAYYEKFPLCSQLKIYWKCHLLALAKASYFQMLVRMKQIMVGKLSIAVDVCSLQSIVYDQMEETSSIALTAASFTDCCFQDIRCSKYHLIFAPPEQVLSLPFLISKKIPNHSTHRLHVCLFCRMTDSAFN